MRPLSLRWRISILGTAVLVSILFVISLVAHRELRKALLGSIDRKLKVSVDATARFLASQPNAPAEKLRAEINRLTSVPPSRELAACRVWRRGAPEDLLRRLPAGDAEHFFALPDRRRPDDDGERTIFNLRIGREHYRTVWKVVDTPSGATYILLAYSSTWVHEEMGQFLRLLVLLGAGVCVGSFVVGLWLVDWTIQPIRRTVRRLRHVTAHNLGRQHLDPRHTPAELRPFLTAMNELLQRLDQVLRRQKQFTGDASHELRTPLALLKSTLQAALAGQPGPKECREAMREALEDCDRMEHLLEQLLLLARLEETGQTPPREPVRLDELAAHLAEVYREQAEQRDMTIRCGALPAMFVLGEETLLQRMLGNLLENAIQYGQPGGTITLSLTIEGTRTQIRIHNEGPAIPPDVLDRLFDRFYRADSSRTRATGGSGLGLAIVRQIAAAHGGTARITSAEDAGTTVTVQLPRHKDSS